MFDQSFSVENFRRIFDYENRKGINLEGKYLPSIKKISEDLKEIQSKLKALKRQKPKNSLFEEQKIELNNIKKKKFYLSYANLPMKLKIIISLHIKIKIRFQ